MPLHSCFCLGARWSRQERTPLFPGTPALSKRDGKFEVSLYFPPCVLKCPHGLRTKAKKPWGLSLSPGSLMVSTVGRCRKIPDPGSRPLPRPTLTPGEVLTALFEFVQEVFRLLLEGPRTKNKTKNPGDIPGICYSLENRCSLCHRRPMGLWTSSQQSCPGPR